MAYNVSYTTFPNFTSNSIGYFYLNANNTIQTENLPNSTFINSTFTIVTSVPVKAGIYICTFSVGNISVSNGGIFGIISAEISNSPQVYCSQIVSNNSFCLSQVLSIPTDGPNIGLKIIAQGNGALPGFPTAVASITTSYSLVRIA
jgi:hypothetical protein